MATELPRNTLDLLPQRTSADCGGNRKKSFRCQDTRRRCEGNPHSGWRWSRRWRSGFWSSTRLASILTKVMQEEGERIAWEKSIDDFSGAPKWCFKFMKRAGLSMRTWMKLAPKLQQPMRIKFWNFILMLSIFESLSTTLSCPESPTWMRPHSYLMCHPTELWTSKEQRPWLLKLVVWKNTFHCCSSLLCRWDKATTYDHL